MTSPELTHALIVGVERYAAGPAWDLPGPASDALRFRSWLLGRGVPAANIVTLLAPLAAPEERPGAREAAREQVAVYERVRDAVTTCSAPRQDSLLWVWWGGHGVLDRDEHLRLFCADAGAADKRNLDLESARRTLATDLNRCFTRQIWIVDACQTFVEDHRFVADLPGERLPAGRRVPDCEQVLLVGASRGQRALNDPDRRTGLFSDLVLTELERSPAAGPWPPEPRQLFRAVDARLAELRRQGSADQLPRIAVHAPESAVVPSPSGSLPQAVRTVARGEVVEALLAYPLTADPVQRQSLVDALSTDCVERMPRHHVLRTDVVMMTGHLSRTPACLWSLYDLVRMLDPDERRGKALEAAVQRCVGQRGETG
ncbi:caspase family protein [Streptacidiphilus pinicola]|uniref:Caspase family protein n=1 Tax=Streptacidiphilus pinicola TaxID=2219663 RepID=A0A2X0IFE1_9ACTN|nr:caspase family protein [Streptacidiphilus pinicola]RAG83772.1 caspase family protein [Streptacidiphilus pinicola]